MIRLPAPSYEAKFDLNKAIQERRSVREYVHTEVGHAAQSIALEAAAMGWGAVDVTVFSDVEIRKVLGLPAGEQPLCILPVGK